MISIIFATSFAGTFQTTDFPVELDFTYAWAGYTPGTTTFTFVDGDPTPTGIVCPGLTTGCVTGGNFETGNGGTGTYNLRLNVSDCTATGSLSVASLVPWRWDVPMVCNVSQRLTLTYDGTGAQYTGDADFGTLTGTGRWSFTFNRLFNIFTPVIVPNATAGLFSGSLLLDQPSPTPDNTGIFFELP